MSATTWADGLHSKSHHQQYTDFIKSSKRAEDFILKCPEFVIVDEAQRLEREGHQILKLNTGNPAPFGLMAPDEMIHDMIDRLDSERVCSHCLAHDGVQLPFDLP